MMTMMMRTSDSVFACVSNQRRDTTTMCHGEWQKWDPPFSFPVLVSTELLWTRTYGIISIHDKSGVNGIVVIRSIPHTQPRLERRTTAAPSTSTHWKKPQDVRGWLDRQLAVPWRRIRKRAGIIRPYWIAWRGHRAWRTTHCHRSCCRKQRNLGLHKGNEREVVR